MGFYIRKSFGLGPFRLNLSKSGVGFSAGVKGARVGVGPRGAYVHAGRGGLYFRQSLGSRRSDSTSIALPSGPVGVIDSVDSSLLLAGESHAEIEAALERVYRRIPRVYIVGVLGVLLAVLLTAVHLWAFPPAPRPALGPRPPSGKSVPTSERLRDHYFPMTPPPLTNRLNTIAAHLSWVG